MNATNLKFSPEYIVLAGPDMFTVHLKRIENVTFGHHRTQNLTIVCLDQIGLLVNTTKSDVKTLPCYVVDVTSLGYPALPGMIQNRY